MSGPHTGVLWVERKYTALSHARFATKARRSRAVLIARLDTAFLKRMCAVILLLILISIYLWQKHTIVQKITST